MLSVLAVLLSSLADTVPTAPLPTWPRALIEVHAGSSLVVSGLQSFVAGGGLRLLVGPRDLDVALGVAVDFDGQGAYVDTGHWDAVATKLRLDAHLGIGDLSWFDARLGLAVGGGARVASHSASAPGLAPTVVVVGATLRAAPEASVDGGPGRFVIAFSLDVTLDVPADVRGFEPVAAGVLLGYRLEL